MPLTVESLQEKLKGLKTQLQQLQDQANAIQGATQLLEVLIKEAEPVVDDPTFQ